MDGNSPHDLRKDGLAKTLLSNPKCLAYIIRDAVEEARGMDLDEIIGRLSLTSGGREVCMLSGELITGYGSIAYDLVFEFLLPSGEKAVVDVEIQGNSPPWTPKRQMMYLSGLAWYANHSPAKDYGSVRPVYCIWIFLNPKAALKNEIHRMKMRRRNYELPMTLVNFHIGEPEEAGCDAMRLLDLLFQKNEDPRRILERVATEFNIDWTDKAEREIMSTLEEFITEYREGLVECAREEGIMQGREEGEIEGVRKGMSSMRAVMVLNYADTVRKAVSAGMSLEDAMSLVPADISDEVSDALKA
jgi:hypothetical protein